MVVARLLGALDWTDLGPMPWPGIVANTCLDEWRRRVQNETMGHRAANTVRCIGARRLNSRRLQGPLALAPTRHGLDACQHMSTDRKGLLAIVLALLVTAVACGSQTATSTSTSQTSDGRDYLTPAGQIVELVHASDDAVALVDWAFSRFAVAGVSEPIVQQLDFAADSPECDGLGGWAITGDGFADITVCLPVDRVCRQVNGLLLTIPGKVCILHELSHAWLSQNASASVREEFVELVSAKAWRSPDVSWSDLGAEQAADTMAWGLMDEPVEILGRAMPSCDLRQSGFAMLTGSTPLVSCNRHNPSSTVTTG